MAFARNDDPRYFSPEGYRNILARALALGYRVVSFREFEPPAGQPVLLLRHDLDRSIGSSLVTAEAEREAGVRATYFVQTACDFYNLLSPDTRQVLRRLADLDHEIGLHYEAQRYAGSDGERALIADLRLLEDLTGQRVRSASQHIPIDADRISLGRHIEREAYEPRFTQPPMEYLSDSLMAWRQATPHDLLDRGASFQFLTHPDTWVASYRDMGEAMRAMLDEELAAVRVRYANATAYYQRLYAERAERDRGFRDRRAWT
jgi:hypothetical protein